MTEKPSSDQMTDWRPSLWKLRAGLDFSNKFSASDPNGHRYFFTSDLLEGSEYLGEGVEPHHATGVSHRCCHEARLTHVNQYGVILHVISPCLAMATYAHPTTTTRHGQVSRYGHLVALGSVQSKTVCWLDGRPLTKTLCRIVFEQQYRGNEIFACWILGRLGCLVWWVGGLLG